MKKLFFFYGIITFLMHAQPRELFTLEELKKQITSKITWDIEADEATIVVSSTPNRPDLTIIYASLKAQRNVNLFFTEENIEKSAALQQLARAIQQNTYCTTPSTYKKESCSWPPVLKAISQAYIQEYEPWCYCLLQ